MPLLPWSRAQRASRVFSADETGDGQAEVKSVQAHQFAWMNGLRLSCQRLNSFSAL